MTCTKDTIYKCPLVDGLEDRPSSHNVSVKVNVYELTPPVLEGQTNG